MSTRARTRSAAAAAAAAAAVTTAVPQVEQKSPPKAEKKQTKGSQSTTQSVVQSEPDQQQEKENVDSNTAKGLKTRTKPKSKSQPTRKVSIKPTSETHCICKSDDDGTPMVQCGQCSVWHHFRCVDLKEEDAEEISVYICPSCATSSGLRTTMTWEGPEAFEGGETVPKKQPPVKRVKRKTPVPLPSSESEADPSSEDEYVLGGSKNQPQGASKRPTRQISATSESESELSTDAKPRRHRIRKVSSNSPAPTASLKRKNTRRDSSTPAPPPPPKRRKSDAVPPTDDPTRKYCLGKLEALFQDIFTRYPHIRTQAENESTETSLVLKPLSDLTEEEKAELLSRSKQFADDLEKCIFETYSEPDKQSQPCAGGQYKDRFRTLQFNLSKVDRVVIHKRIASAEITPKEISTMSSADLANEEMKQSIKIAEKEALAYSILTPTAVPRAKITHKGLEDIENVHGSEVTTLQDEERSRREQEEKRERERMARLRSQRTSSISVPPESPIVTQQSWGGPPSLPTHPAIPLGDVSASPNTAFAGERSPVTSTFTHHHVSDPAEPELNLSDFINMDEEVTSAPVDATPQGPSSANQPDVEMQSPSTSPTIKAPEPPATSPTAMSPFAQKPDHTGSTAFDLNSLWSAPKKSPDPHSSSSPKEPPAAETGTSSPPVVPEKDVNMDVEASAEDDLDFDMFLEEKDLPANSAETQQAALDALPQVWTGKITMPLDSTVPQDTSVVARQVGGRRLEHDSLLWKTLFPAESLRIEGRVPVENSSKFLLQMRMNVSKELVAVAFTPISESSDITFRILSDFLIAKKRHGLIFPWGNRSKDHLPGRELYIIPLLSSDPLPEYMELLDDLHLPKLRKKDLLVGIFVLNKGKLTLPPTAAPPPANIAYPPPASFNPPPFPPSIAPPVPPVPAALPANIAAEVATLTPEQIQLMIQTLTNNGAVPLAIPQPPALQSQPPPPPGMPPQPPAPFAAPPPPPGQPWPGPAPGYGAAYSPPRPPPTSPPNPHNQPRSSGPLSWDRPSTGNRHDRGSRGWQDGRGRGRGRLHDNPDRPPVDSGWPRRPRNENGDGRSTSPVRRWS